DQVNSLPGLAAQADDDVRGNVWVLGEASQSPFQLAVVRPVKLHRAALFMDDRHHAIDVGKLVEQAAHAQALGDVLARTRGAVDGANEGDVVARAEAAVAAVIAVEEARLGRSR